MTLSFRTLGAGLMSGAIVFSTVQAAQSNGETPAALPSGPGLSLTPGSPSQSAAPASPVNPASSVTPIGSTGGSNPLVHPPAQVTPAPSAAANLPPVGTPLPEGSDTEKSVVQIINAFQEPNWGAPWIFDSPHYASGTGFLIEGNRIMTNAHVVAWAKQLLVRRYHDPQKYFATVEFVAQDIDLAILKVNDPNFYKGMKPLPFGTLPKVRSGVITYGFPAGGQQISYTRGVVSRIEVESYVHIGNRAFLAVQTDAAINPGNSGGPVIQDGKVVGVAFEGLPSLQNTGFFIPTTLIHHFLDDIKDGTYDGVPEAGLRVASLQNPAFRRMLKIPDESKRGVRVDQILEIPSTQELIKPNDVVMQVGEYPIDDDGTITYEGNTVGASVAFDLLQNNQTAAMKIWRDGKMIDVNLPVKVYRDDFAQGSQYDVLPRYFVYGGLVFTTLSLDYMKTIGRSFDLSGGHDLIYELIYRHMEDPAHWRPEPVVLASILDHPVNADLQTRGETMVDKINGVRIERLSDLPKAFAAATGTFDVIDFLPDHHFEVLNKDEAEKANPDILQTYRVPAQSRL